MTPFGLYIQFVDHTFSQIKSLTVPVVLPRVISVKNVNINFSLYVHKHTLPAAFFTSDQVSPDFLQSHFSVWLHALFGEPLFSPGNTKTVAVIVLWMILKAVFHPLLVLVVSIDEWLKEVAQFAHSLAVLPIIVTLCDDIAEVIRVCQPELIVPFKGSVRPYYHLQTRLLTDSFQPASYLHLVYAFSSKTVAVNIQYHPTAYQV